MKTLALRLLAEGYRWLYMNTTREPYTHIMRRNPALLAVPALILGITAAIRLPHSWKGRVTMLIIAGGLAFLAGHVYWGQA
jgi:hypothetical protein